MKRRICLSNRAYLNEQDLLVMINLRENGLAALNGGRESLLGFSFFAQKTLTLMKLLIIFQNKEETWNVILGKNVKGK